MLNKPWYHSQYHQTLCWYTVPLVLVLCTHLGTIVLCCGIESTDQTAVVLQLVLTSEVSSSSHFAIRIRITMDSQLTVYTCQGVKRNQLPCNVCVSAVHYRYAYCSHHKPQMRHAPFSKLTEREVEITVMLREQNLVDVAFNHIANTTTVPPRRSSASDSKVEFDDEDTSQLPEEVNRMFTELRLALSRS